MTRKHRKPTKTPDVQRRSITPLRGSPVHAVRWKPLTWNAIYDVVQENGYKIKANRVSEIAVQWGLAFIRSLGPTMQRRLFERALTDKEKQQLRSELTTRLGSAAEILRLDDRLGFALPRPMKAVLRQEKEHTGVSMGRQIRQALQSNPVRTRSVSQSVSQK
jgi:hypothetical protein